MLCFNLRWTNSVSANYFGFALDEDSIVVVEDGLPNNSKKTVKWTSATSQEKLNVLILTCLVPQFSSSSICRNMSLSVLVFLVFCLTAVSKFNYFDFDYCCNRLRRVFLHLCWTKYLQNVSLVCMVWFETSSIDKNTMNNESINDGSEMHEWIHLTYSDYVFSSNYMFHIHTHQEQKSRNRSHNSLDSYTACCWGLYPKANERQHLLRQHVQKEPTVQVLNKYNITTSDKQRRAINRVLSLWFRTKV